MRAGPLLAIVGAAGLAAVALLLTGPLGGGAGRGDDSDRGDGASTAEPAATPALAGGDPAAPHGAPVAAPIRTPEPPAARAAPTPGAAGPRVPRTLQSLHGRVTAPANLAVGVSARVVDARGPACDWTRPAADGSLILELERAVTAARIEFEHPALAAQTMGPYDVEPGVRRGFGVVRLVPARTVVGAVATAGGAPAAGAQVFLLPLPGRLDGGLGPVTTGADGGFELAGVPPRHGGLLVLHPDGAAHAAQLPPPTEPLDVVLEAHGRGFDVAAHDGDGRAVAGARVDLRIGTTTLATAATAADGRARLGPLPPIAFDLEATAPGRAPARVEGVQPRDDGAPIGLLLAPAEPEEHPDDGDADPRDAPRDHGWLGYELTDADGRPLAGATLELWSRPPGPLDRFALPGRRAEPDRSARTDHRGWAVWQDLADGPWWLVARADGFLPALVEGVRAREDDPRPPLLSLEPAGTIRGTVVAPDGRPILGTAVDLTHAADRASPLRARLVTDARGRFEARDLPLGGWIARALPPSGFGDLVSSETAAFDLGADEPAALELLLPERE